MDALIALILIVVVIGGTAVILLDKQIKGKL